MPDMSIAEILSKVRIATATDTLNEPPQRFRRDTGHLIPLVSEPDDGDKIPLGKASYSIEEFASLDDEDFLRNAYRVILGREVDGVGRAYYLPALRQGQASVVRILSALCRSDEGRARRVKVRWLLPAAIIDRVSTIPIVGKPLEPMLRFFVRSTTNRRLSLLSQRNSELISEVNTSLSAVRRNLARVDAKLVLLEKEGEAIRSQLMGPYESALQEIRATRREMSEQRAALANLISAAKANLPEKTALAADDAEKAGLDTIYLSFENRFRGSQREIFDRSKRYLPLFRASAPVANGGTVLDIGCGRGEFVSLLTTYNIRAEGIDINRSMLAEGQKLKLNVYEGEAIKHLQSLPSASLAAISAFHVVEHIDFSDVISLFDEALRVLVPGGFVLFETPNPENLVVGACTFNLDPTHKKPLPPDFLRFIAEVRGFTNTRIIRIDQDCELDRTESGFHPAEPADWFRQPLDYALYAEKPIEMSETS